jgi:nicotinamidase/pyrazinamidase
VVGTIGQQKPATTLLERRVAVANRAGDVPNDGAQQILLEKQALDCFTAIPLKAILDRTGAERYVVYGVATDVCVKFAIEGLLKSGKRVELVSDAIRGLDDASISTMTAAFLAQGGILTTTTVVRHG